MKTAYFTFGCGHYHHVNGVDYDKDVVLRVISHDPRATMFASFGPKWSMQYDEPPKMKYFPRGILDHWQNPPKKN